MVRNELIEELLKLSDAEREFVTHVLLASLKDDSPDNFTAEEEAEMDAVSESFDRDPGSFYTLEQVREILEKRRAGTP